jgi:hypothetical protein
MPSKRSSSNPDTTGTAPARPREEIDIDDAAIDESAAVGVDEDLVELANPDDEKSDEGQSRPQGEWRERDANRRAHGPDDLKS